MIYFLVSLFVLGVLASGRENEELKIQQLAGPDAKITRFFLQFCTSVMECHSIFYYQHGKGGRPNVNRIKTIPPPPVTPNVVFVQPPDIKYKHNIHLNGGDDSQTTVFVLPQKDEHSINITDTRTPQIEVGRPMFIYLRNHPADKIPPMQPQTSFSKVQMRYTVTEV